MWYTKKMIKDPLITGEYYHIYNRGVDKRDLFNDLKDFERFKESIKQFNQVEGIGSLQMHRKSVRALSSNPSSEPLVAIVALCINPKDFDSFFQIWRCHEYSVGKSPRSS